jgi:O-antigen ligase
MSTKILNTTNFLWSFLFFQILITLTFLGTKVDNVISFDTYLQSVKYSTLILLIFAVFLVFHQRKILFKFQLLKYIFRTQIVILYLTMVIHTDIKAITSPTIFLMLLVPLIIFSNKIDLSNLNYIAIIFSYLNFVVIAFQNLEIIPVAQDNIRDGLGLISDRPTGLLFNAFAMGYASVIIFLICLYFLKEKKLLFLNSIAIIFSFIAVLLSATRTPLLLLVIFGILIMLQGNKIVTKNWKLLTFLLPSSILLFPLMTVLIGNFIGSQDMATLNGRTFLWNCVTSKWKELLPFGMGVQGAFPQGFCSKDEWFSKLRHPENMFLLNYVESGLLGVVGLILLFGVSFWYSGKALQKGSALQMAVTSTFFMSSIFYVPLFHYLPFLENRTADRGIYNFFLITVIWMIVMNLTNSKTIKLLTKKR